MLFQEEMIRCRKCQVSAHIQRVDDKVIRIETRLRPHRLSIA